MALALALSYRYVSMMPNFSELLVSTEDLLFAADAASCLSSSISFAPTNTFSSYSAYSVESFCEGFLDRVGRHLCQPLGLGLSPRLQRSHRVLWLVG